MTAGSLRPQSLTLVGPAVVDGMPVVPGDKSISHRALLLSALAVGESHLIGLSAGDDVARTRRAIELLGATVTQQIDGSLWVGGGRLGEPDQMLDHGNSGTGIRLTAGVVAGLDQLTILTGDEFLRRRPMGRIVEPLRRMGATVDGRQGGSLAPIAIRGGTLRGITYRTPVASAQVKSAIMLAGLQADGPTTIIEPVATRRHTEEMLTAFGAEVTVDGTAVTILPGTLRSTSIDVARDPSQGAFWIVAGVITPGSKVVVENLYLGEGRAGFIDVLNHMGAELAIDHRTGTVFAEERRLTGTSVDPAEVASFIDEIPILAVAAATARGTTVFSGAEDLRVKESDRIVSTVQMLQAFGVTARETPDGLIIEGGTPFTAAEVDAHGDHRIAMAAAIAALRAPGTTTICGWESVATSYPNFENELNRLTDGATRATTVEVT